MSKRVLVVDDEEEYRALLGQVLGEAGYEVLTAANARDGLALCAAKRPDVILLDVMLPDMLGFEFCKKVRAAEGGESTPILFCTVRSAVSSLARAVKAGSTDYLIKPFVPADVLKRVRGALRQDGS